jgi:spermidine synthase
VEKVDCVELVPGVLRAAKWFPEANHGVLGQPGYRVIQDDGRNYELTTDETYDVIAVDATSPKMAGDGSLYTVDFYRTLEQRLSDDGLVAVWLPFHLLSDREMRMTARTLMEVFPHTSIWLSAIRHHALLVGSRQALRLDVAAMAEKLARPGVREDLALMRVNDPLDVLGGFVMGEQNLAAYVEGARINSDDHPYLEFTPALAYFAARRFLVENLASFVRYREDPWPMVVNAGATPEETAAYQERVRRRTEATQHNIAGDIYFYLEQMDQAKAEYETALQLDPADKNWANPAWDVPIR